MDTKTPAAKQSKPESGNDERGHRRRLTGTVTSDKMDKTVVVLVTRRVREPKFGKYVIKRAKYKAHSETNSVHVGDRVQLIESRPLSKETRWRVEKLVERARRSAK